MCQLMSHPKALWNCRSGRTNQRAKGWEEMPWNTVWGHDMAPARRNSRQLWLPAQDWTTFQPASETGLSASPKKWQQKSERRWGGDKKVCVLGLGVGSWEKAVLKKNKNKKLVRRINCLISITGNTHLWGFRVGLGFLTPASFSQGKHFIHRSSSPALIFKT